MLNENLSQILNSLISILLVKQTVAQLNIKIQSKSVTNLNWQRCLK